MVFLKVSKLKKICLIKIVCSLWNANTLKELEDDIRIVLRDISSDRDESLHKLESKLEEKISALPLPEKLKREALNYQKPITEEVLAWLYQNLIQFKITKKLPGTVYWTPWGTVDKIKTARALTADESLTVLERYKLACVYYLEDLIPLLRSRLLDPKMHLCNLDYPSGYSIAFWFLKGVKNYNHYAYYEFDFVKTAVSGNVTACNYFIEKLSPKEKINVIWDAADQILENSSRASHNILKKPYHEVIRFLFVNMTQEEKAILCKRRPNQIELWTCFLIWQWQSPHCLDILDLVSNFGSENSYKHLLLGSVARIRDGYRDLNYLELCRKLWDDSPAGCKRSLIEEFKKAGSYVFFWRILIEAEESTTLEHLLKSASEEDKEKIFSTNRLWFEFTIVEKNKWDFFKFLLGVLELGYDTLIGWKSKYPTSQFWVSDDLAERESRTEMFNRILDEYISENYEQTPPLSPCNFDRLEDDLNVL